MLVFGCASLSDLANLAVVPSLMGPLQTVLLVLPQVLLGLVLVVRAVSSPLAWRAAAGRLVEAARTRPFGTAARAGAAVLAAAAVWWLLSPIESGSDSAGGGDAQGVWPAFHGGPSRSGVAGSAADGSAVTGKLRWKFRDALILERRPFASSPAVAGSRVLIGSDNYKLYCLGLEKGDLQWTFEAQYPIFSSPAVSDGRVYIGEGLHYDRALVTVHAKIDEYPETSVNILETQ